MDIRNKCFIVGMVEHWKVCSICLVFTKSKSTETVGQKYEKQENNLEAKQNSRAGFCDSF